MAMQHYEGEFGIFDYDDTEFKVVSGDEALDYVCEDIGKDSILYYIGKETDGSKIKIPEGIKDCSGMFYGCESRELLHTFA